METLSYRQTLNARQKNNVVFIMLFFPSYEQNSRGKKKLKQLQHTGSAGQCHFPHRSTVSHCLAFYSLLLLHTAYQDSTHRSQTASDHALAATFCINTIGFDLPMIPATPLNFSIFNTAVCITPYHHSQPTDTQPVITCAIFRFPFRSSCSARNEAVLITALRMRRILPILMTSLTDIKAHCALSQLWGKNVTNSININMLFILITPFPVIRHFLIVITRCFSCDNDFF